MENWKARLSGEAVTSFILAWEAILVWNIIVPYFGVVEYVIRRPGQWSQLLGVLALGGSYYFLLSITLPVAKRYNPRVHPITTAYFGGWWLIIILAALSVQSALFNDVLGLPMATSGTNLLFITLIVGTAKYWIDGYRNPPKAPDSENTNQTAPSAGQATSDKSITGNPPATQGDSHDQSI